MLPKLFALTMIVARATANCNEYNVAPQDVIHKDVVIIGGGASGTYAAVRLREDFKKSIVVVERDDHLVTHTLETLLRLLLTTDTGRTCQSQRIQYTITDTKLTLS
jgi:flavin-dependent dehydrogenase